MKVNLDVQLTLMASSLYRLFALKIGNRYQNAKSPHIFRDFIDAIANINITKSEVIIKFQKRSHNPFLIAPALIKSTRQYLGLGNKDCSSSWAEGPWC